jgi:hypothetical protein
MSEGPPVLEGGASVPIVVDGIPPGNIIGFIHNHPGGTTVPSPPDVAIFNDMVHNVSIAGGDISVMSYYVIGPEPASRIYAYGPSSVSGVEGPEVNPDAEIC